MVVAHVGVEAAHVGDEAFPVVRADTSLGSRGLKEVEVLALEVKLEDHEESGSFVADLMENHLGASPRRFVDVVSVILLFVG